MTRTGRAPRFSRGLIALLLIVVVSGGVLYFYNTTRSNKRDAALRGSSNNSATGALPPSPLAMAPAAITAPDEPAKQTPAAQPSTQPAASTFGQPQVTPPSAPAERPDSASALLADGLAKKDRNELLAARKLLNDALASNQLSPDETHQCKSALSEINQIVVFSPKRFPDDEYGGAYTVQSGDLLKKIADRHETTWEMLARINNLSDPKKLRAGQTIKIIKGPFHAVVSKSTFTMDLYVGAAPGEKGSMYVMTLPVGLGTDNSTPTGVWMVEPGRKIKNPKYYSPRGEGVIDSDDPKNPLGERWIGLTGIDGQAVGKESYGIHGTIEPDSIGKMASMGCIRLRNEDVEKVFDMLVEGKSTVVVRD